VVLISDVLQFGRLWYDGPGAVNNAIGYAKHYSRPLNVVIRVYDATGNVTETHEHKGPLLDPFVVNFRQMEMEAAPARSSLPSRNLETTLENLKGRQRTGEVAIA
jgi:hypothetical protein